MTNNLRTVDMPDCCPMCKYIDPQVGEMFCLKNTRLACEANTVCDDFEEDKEDEQA